MDISILIAALILVESSGNDSAVGDHGLAAGCLQLHVSFVLDVNRIAGTSYAPQDRLSRAKSMEMAAIWLGHYEAAYERRTGRRAGYEELARMFNGGYEGYFKNPQATDSYWNKVSRALERKRN